MVREARLAADRRNTVLRLPAKTTLCMQERDRPMFGFFKRTPLIEPAVMNWQFDCFEWLLKNMGEFSDRRCDVEFYPFALQGGDECGATEHGAHG